MQRWLVAGMLTVFMAINFADKAAFGLAGGPIIADMHLSHAAFGVLGAAFFALFSFSALLVGWLGDRASGKWMLAAMALIWSAAQLPMIAPAGFAVFLFCRVLLGVGEGPALGTSLHEAYKYFGREQRPLVTGIIEAGIPLGAAVATIAVTYLIVTRGWHVAFGALGIASLIWCCLWILLDAKPGDSDAAMLEPQAGGRVRFRVLLLNRTMIAVIAASFAAYWSSAVAIIWLPSFLEAAAHLSPAQAAGVLTIAWIVQIPLFPVVGLFSGALSARGYSSAIARGALATAGNAICGVAMLALAATSSPGILVVLSAAFLSCTVVVVTVLPPLVAEIAPSAQRCAALGWCVAVGSLGGVLAPVIFGRLVDVTSGGAGYRAAFVACGSVVLIAAALSQILMRPREDQERLRRLSHPSAAA